MFKRIAVAIDASPTSQLALETAIRLAVDLQARLRIVHAVDLANINLGGEFPLQADVSESLTTSGQALLDRAEKVAAAAGLAAETSLLRIDIQGLRLAEAIAEDADGWTADLVVVGTHGRRGLSRLFLGSVADGIARVARQPVLLVRAAEGPVEGARR